MWAGSFCGPEQSLGQAMVFSDHSHVIQKFFSCFAVQTVSAGEQICLASSRLWSRKLLSLPGACWRERQVLAAPQPWGPGLPNSYTLFVGLLNCSGFSNLQWWRWGLRSGNVPLVMVNPLGVGFLCEWSMFRLCDAGLCLQEPLATEQRNLHQDGREYIFPAQSFLTHYATTLAISSSFLVCSVASSLSLPFVLPMALRQANRALCIFKNNVLIIVFLGLWVSDISCYIVLVAVWILGLGESLRDWMKHLLCMPKVWAFLVSSLMPQHVIPCNSRRNPRLWTTHSPWVLPGVAPLKI